MPEFSWLYGGTKQKICVKCGNAEGPPRPWWNKFEACLSCVNDEVTARVTTRGV